MPTFADRPTDAARVDGSRHVEPEDPGSSPVGDRLARLEAALPGAVFEFVAEPDGSMRVQFVSAKIVEMFGLPAEDARLFELFTERVDERDRGRLMLSIHAAVAARSPWEFEGRYTKPAGATIWFRAESSLVPDGGDTLVYAGILTDITAHKLAEQAQQESERLLKESQRVARLGHYVFDAGTGAWTCSEMLEEIFGIDAGHPHDVEGWLSIIHPDDQASMRHHLVEEVLGRKQPFNREYRVVRASDRRICWVRGLGELGFDEACRPVTMMGTIQDITAQRRSAEEVLRLNAELEHRVADRTAQLELANEELEAFAYSVSHDLRAPLRHIDGFVDLLQTTTAGRLDEKSVRYFGLVRDAARKMGRLIDDLLAFSRMGRSTLHPSSVRLDELLDNTLRALSHDIDGRAIEWRRAPLPVVLCDAPMMKQVFVNLVGNAVKYSRGRQPAVIEIGTLDASPGEHVVYVRDNGAGFDMQYAHKLFGVFQRLHREEEFAGSGVGLASVRRIIARHGGRTWAEGLPGAGATFYFSLPHPPAPTD